MRCKTCRKQIARNHRKFCSKECYWKSLEGVKGETAPGYKRIVGKSQVHKWMDVHYGQDKICEGAPGIKCRGKATVYDWALKKGYEYERKRENFLRLCRSCHRRYDLTEEKKKQAIENLWWKAGMENPGKLENLFWNKDREKMKETNKNKWKTKIGK